MKLKNTTDFSDQFLRRLCSWICHEIKLPAREVQAADFSNYSYSYKGYACGMTFRVWIGTRNWYALIENYHKDRVLNLVSTTAHELEHVLQHLEKRSTWNVFPAHKMSQRAKRKIVEGDANRVADLVVDKFVANREALLAKWNEAPHVVPIKPKKSIQEVRKANAERMLAKWQRNLKRAESKVRHWRSKVRYYEREAIKRAQPVTVAPQQGVGA